MSDFVETDDPTDEPKRAPSPAGALIDKAVQAPKSEDALRFSQAAINVLHALNMDNPPSD